MSVRIINADVMDGLATLADESVHCVVTSPPYWGLRDYGVDGQIGQEPTFPEFITKLVAVFGEVRRVLRSDGVCFVNMGDSYAMDTKWGGQSGWKHTDAEASGTTGYRKRRASGLKPKDLIGQPWRLAFALQDAGWWLRGDYIWSKPNPMPESVMDRCTKAHEYVFHLTKSAKYFWDADAIREVAQYDGPKELRNIGAKGNANGFRGGSYVNGKPGPRTEVGNTKPDKQRGHSRRHAGFNERWDAMPKEEQRFSRNKRSVWTIATVPFPDAHFATFPPALAELCIKAGCPAGGTVLDPFSGAGTTALVADRLQRNAIGIELNPDYAAMSEQRIKGDRGGLLDAMENVA